MHTLSLRLKTLAALVPFGARVCDIGCDHGYLSIYLKANGIADRVIATDIKEKPLENARKNILSSGVTGIELRLCNGLSGIKKNEVNTVIIAGMGGEVISEILSQSEWIKAPDITLILQPTTSPEALRKFLCNNGFTAENEIPLCENGKIYSIIKCRFTNSALRCEPYYYYIGSIPYSSADGRCYIEKQQKRIFECMKALENIPAKRDDYLYYRAVYEGITAAMR